MALLIPVDEPDGRGVIVNLDHVVSIHQRDTGVMFLLSTGNEITSPRSLAEWARELREIEPTVVGRLASD